MSKQLAEQQQVYSFLQKTLDKSREQDSALQLMINRMLEIETNVNETAAEIKVLAKEIRDDNRLLPSEIDDLYNAVVEKSVSLAKDRNDEEDEHFTKVVGKYRKFIWSKMKKKFGTSKYIHIKRIDFKPALQFVSDFNPEDYI